MYRFTKLYRQLDATTRTNEKVAAMCDYFAKAEPNDAAWAVYYLSGKRPKRLVRTGDMRRWAGELAKLPNWLLDECYTHVGDTAETIALILPASETETRLPLHYWIEDRLLPMAQMDDEGKRSAMVEVWSELSRPQRFVWNKLVTSGFRVGVSKRLLVRALSAVSGVDEPVIAHRLMGQWKPSPESYQNLVSEETSDDDHSRPYPFCLAHPIEDPAAELGDANDWIAEWKWDGIRAQALKRRGDVFIWSRRGELITDQFPDVEEVLRPLPNGTVLDGELLAWKHGGVLPFSQLQRRLGRKRLSRKMLEEVPIAYLAFDILEQAGKDIRAEPTVERRKKLESLFNRFGIADRLLLSEIATGNTWDDLAAARLQSRDRLVEGLMLKRRNAAYEVGRKTGTWWKWKVEPFTFDGVLIYAQRGSGKRAGLYSDYHLAVWDGGELVKVTQAYSGLTNAEIREVDRWIKANTIERFGPVRSVPPEHVFEVAFEGIRRSNRHKSGLALRFPRISRWRRDKLPKEAGTLEELRQLLPPADRSSPS